MKDQQSLQQVEKEILVVEKMISQLEQLLQLYYDINYFEDVFPTMRDIETYKKELQKLIKAKDKIIDLN
jgi:selenocysteine-specific translation elongation factor